MTVEQILNSYYKNISIQYSIALQPIRPQEYKLYLDIHTLFVSLCQITKLKYKYKSHYETNE